MKNTQEYIDREVLNRATVLAMDIWELVKPDITDESTMAIYTKALQRCDKLQKEIEEKYERD